MSDRNASEIPGQELLPLWLKAASYAAFAHRHQLRKDKKTPYVAHVFRVALTVSQVFGHADQTTLAVALLHDTIEDTTTDYEDISHFFGKEVAKGVALLTKNMALPEEEREATYDAALAKAPWQVKLIKLADVYDNLCDVETNPSEKVASRKADAIDKARRAIALAKDDAKKHEELARAVDLVARLVKFAEG